MTSLVSIGSVVKPLTDLVEHFFPNAEDKAKAKAMLQQIADQAGDQQIAVDLAEARSGNWFVGGWRSYVGWICGTALGYAMILRPILLPWIPALAPVNLTPAMSILGIMLGVGGAHAIVRTTKGL